MSSGVVVKTPPILDFRDVTPDELVALAQGLSVSNDPPFFQSRRFWPRHLQDQIVHLDDFVTGLPVIITGSEIRTGPIIFLSMASVLVDFSLDLLNILWAFLLRTNKQLD